MKYCFLFLCSLLLLASCSKDSKKDPVPSISFTGITDTVMKAASAEIIQVGINFSDGNGDLGVDPASGYFDIYTIDSRDSSEQGYYFPSDVPGLRRPGKALSGSFVLDLEAAFVELRPDHPKGDTLYYDIYIRDQAGNKSNRVRTPTIILLP